MQSNSQPTASSMPHLTPLGESLGSQETSFPNISSSLVSSNISDMSQDLYPSSSHDLNIIGTIRDNPSVGAKHACGQSKKLTTA